MADATTTNLGLIQPEVGAATNTWGTSLNADILSIDNMFAKASTSVTFHVNNQNISGSSYKLDQIKMGDNRALQFGAAPDYWLMYDSSNTQFELNSTNVNGAGADGVVFAIGDGTDDVVFTGNISTAQVDILAEGDLRLQDASGGQYVGLDAPATVSGTYTLTFPAAVGAVNQVLSLNNTDGTLQWATPEVGDITSVVAGTGLSGGGTAGAVTLNVEASQTQITAVGALNAGSITSGFGEIDTGANTIITTGSIRGGNIIVDDAGKLMLEDTTGGEYVAFKAAGTTTSYTLIMPAAVPSANQVLSASDGSGTMAWTTPEVGDITGVTAGTGLSGGGTSGAVTLNVDASQTQITSVGALNAGSITSGFTSIDVGSGAITTSGTVSGGTLTGTLSTAAQTNITSVGTLTSVTTSGDLDVDGTANLDAVDIDGNVNLAGYLDMYNSLYITRADNSAGLQLICTDADAGSGPLILLDRNTASPADGDTLGKIYSQGRNDADQLVTYSHITTKSIDVTDGTEDGEMIFNIMVNGTSTTVLDLYGPEIEMNTTLVDMNANLDVSGALSKGSGSFKIDHPLPSMKDTHSLVHSFTESPRADLIYRGSVALSSGSASVDLDEEVGLTDGTWELLCRDPQVFLQNEDGWSAVRGSVSGSTLILTCKDTTSSDTISWMVVAERQDDHMKDPSIDWTDDDGRPILEPLKRDNDDR